MNNSVTSSAADGQLPERGCHRPWAGVVASFFIPGAAQFLAGGRRLGLRWFFGLWLLSLVGWWCFATAKVPSLIPGIALLLVELVLWGVMLLRSRIPIPRMRWHGWTGLVITSAILWYATGLVDNLVTRPFYMPTHSMEPTIAGEREGEGGRAISGDRVIVDRTAYWFAPPQAGDVVAFRTKGIEGLPDNQFYVKRVIGVPGDELSVLEGRLVNHGILVDQPPGVAALHFSTNLAAQRHWMPGETFAVPPGTCFVVGDNTTNSYDSRYYGPIPEKNLMGRVSKIYWPLQRAGSVK